MKIKVFQDYQTLSINAAKMIINQVKENKQSVIGFATGSSPLGIYQELIKDHQENKTTYQELISFNLDEYYGIDKEHKQSYYYFMQENLFKHIDINHQNINFPSGKATDINKECDYYNQKLRNNPIDIQILGIGANGHIGFNEPGTDMESITHYVKLDEKTRQDNARFFNSIDEVPEYAITMGIKNILAAKKIILVANGSNKIDAIYKMVKGPIDSSCPASFLQMHNNVTVFLDEIAAEKL